MAGNTKKEKQREEEEAKTDQKASENGTSEDSQPTDEAEERDPIEIPTSAIQFETEFKTYPAGAFDHEELGLEEDELVDMYSNMMLQRRFEERCRQMYQQQKISGFLHLYIGQEAVSTGTAHGIRLGEDTVITAYRDHGIALAMGMDPNACMAELFGKEDGCSKGKGGSMHFFDAEKRMFGGHGIVGSHIPVGAGIAFAHKYREEDEVCLCFFGDGAMQQGAFHEAANLAGLYDLPLVLICENNMYGMGTHIDRAAADPDLYKQGVPFDIPGSLVNGMDVFAVNKAIQDHVAEAREGNPTFMEIRTYRYQGHSISDPAKYRTKDELQSRKEQDAIIRLKGYLIDNDIADNDDIDEIDEQAKQVVLDAIEFAENSDLPPEESIYDHIYTQEDYPFITD